MIRPSYLIKGDLVAIVAPAGIIKDKTTIYKATELLESWGLRVVLGKHIFDRGNHFSSSDKNRLSDIQEALDNPEIKAIWCARGGYGTVRIIDDIDFSKFLTNPKWIIGYSDITVLHSHIHNLGVTTLHAMMPVNLANPTAKIQQSIDTLKQALFGEKINYKFPYSEYNIQGNVSGAIVGGNLTLLENSLGTTTSISTENKILFIEEIGEYKYHIDRMLWALKRNGLFKDCKALIVGDMSNIKRNDPNFGQAIEELILAFVQHSGIPVAFNFPAGHEDINKALYIGGTIELKINSDFSSLTFL